MQSYSIGENIFSFLTLISLVYSKTIFINDTTTTVELRCNQGKNWTHFGNYSIDYKEHKQEILQGDNNYDNLGLFQCRSSQGLLLQEYEILTLYPSITILEKNSLNSFRNFTDLVYQGENISINCRVFSNPEPKIKWSMISDIDGRKKVCLPNINCKLYKIGKYEYILEWKIPNVTQDYRGNYTCSSWIEQDPENINHDFVIVRIRKNFLWVTPLVLNFGALALLIVIINFTKALPDKSEKGFDTALLKPTRKWENLKMMENDNISSDSQYSFRTMETLTIPSKSKTNNPDGVLKPGEDPKKLSPNEWKMRLNDDEMYRITREKGTESPYVGFYSERFDEGVYTCACCGADLFDSDTKYSSGCGWPAFYAAKNAKIDKGKIDESQANVARIQDNSYGRKRVEVICKNCDAHLGHVFSDGPADKTGERFCINSKSMGFKPKE
ncbi:DgyrCDS4765 [Dimorphilus gyrociliatus]|uniref:peptide-methionine (R)-S-oxide reductase n=1 Tax=Dimorphilus gyrociliatus TaxID=2664684 RepID=A0A7I8VMM5_9ANNE|nr:DgyrCDS4765 [Dimorphilus gyrociliatus]